MGAPAEIRELLATGRLRWSRSVQSLEEARFCLDELRGRLVELTGRGASATLTAAVTLVLDAQRHGEPAAWITRSDALFFPPDVAGHGVDLGALAIVRLDAAPDRLRAADTLLRSGAFGLVVLDDAGGAAAGGAASSEIPLAAQVRFVNLTRRHDSALVLLRGGRRGGDATPRSAGSLASLRIECTRRRIAPGRFACTWHVVKDKRRGKGWTRERVFDGPLGLR